jgi:hypothetical protein
LLGVSKLKERWTRNSALGWSKKRSRINAALLFVSRNADYVGVAVGNRITVLRKGDGYASPCGVYTSKQHSTCYTSLSFKVSLIGDEIINAAMITKQGMVLMLLESIQLSLSSFVSDHSTFHCI